MCRGETRRYNAANGGYKHTHTHTKAARGCLVQIFQHASKSAVLNTLKASDQTIQGKLYVKIISAFIADVLLN